MDRKHELDLNQCDQQSTNSLQMTQLGRAVQLETLENNNISLTFYDNDQVCLAQSSQKDEVHLNPADLLLIEKSSEDNQRTLEKFLTIQRRKKLTKAHSQSISIPDHLSFLLDDIANKQTQYLLERISYWKFNAFTLDITTGGRPLPVLLFHLMDFYGLIDTFKLEPVKVWKCFSMIESGYHSNNPYHNAIHATDVTQAMHCFLQEPKILKHLSPLEIMSALIAAVTHDLDHPGVNQPFLVATSNHLAALYKNASILENHHWRSAVSCMLNSMVFDQLPHAEWEKMVNQIQLLILSTDITRHQEFLTNFKKYIVEDKMDLEDYDCRLFVLQIAMKCADICNVCRPWEISKKWSDKVCEEFFRQGDYERNLKLPVTSMCDRTKTPASKIQIGFIKYVVAMLFELWDQFHGTALSAELVRNLRQNLENWEKIYQQEEGTIHSDDSSTANIHDDSVDTKASDEICSSPDSEISATMNKGRRYTLPLVLPQYLPITRLRRESLHGCALEIKSEIIQMSENNSESSMDKQSLQHQPASFPPYFRFSRQTAVSPKAKSKRTCRAEASIDTHNNHSQSSDTSSSPECSDRNCNYCFSPPEIAVTENNTTESNGMNNEADDDKSGSQSQQDCTSLSDEFNVESASHLGSFPQSNQPGSLDLKNYKLFDLPYLELHPSMRNMNSITMPTAPRRGSMPATLIELNDSSNKFIDKKPMLPARSFMQRRSSFPREYKTISSQLVDQLAHISSSESETESACATNPSIANSQQQPKLDDSSETLPPIYAGTFLEGRRRSAPIIGTTIRTRERLNAIYAAATNETCSNAQDSGQADNILWKMSDRKSSMSLEYIYQNPFCHNQMLTAAGCCQRTMSGLQLLSSIWNSSRAYVEQRPSGSLRGESSFHLHSSPFEQKNSGIDVCSSQYLLSKGRRASAPVVISS